MMKNRLSIKEQLNVIDCRDFTWWNKLAKEEKDSINFWILMRYCSSIESKNKNLIEYYLRMSNDIINLHFNDLRKHPELQHRLLQVMGLGKKQFHKWIPPMKGRKNKKSKKLNEFYMEKYPHLNDTEIDIIINNTTDEEHVQMFIEYGFDDKKIMEYLSD